MAIDITSYLLGKKGSGGASGLKVEVVQELPTTGEANILYLVPKTTTGTNNVFEEYLWIDNAWELIGTTDIDISGKQDVFQFSTIPTASASNVGKIIQYIGTTNLNYTNGYFYICILDSNEYVWTQINIQPSSDVSGKEDKSNKVTSVSSESTDEQYPSAKCLYNLISTLGADGGVYVIKDLSYSEPFVFAGKKKGLYVFMVHSTFYYKVIPSASTQSLSDTYIMALVLKEDFPENYSSGQVDLGWTIYVDKSYNVSNRGSMRVAYPFILSTTFFSIGSSNYVGHFLVSGEIQTIAGTKTFSSIPKQSNTTAPTDDKEFTNKKYVDDKPTTYTGYDATKTQVLKNVNGTLTWVDE